MMPVVATLGAFLASSSLWAAAPAGRYSIAIDTVKDNRTGLTWQRVVPSGSYRWQAAKEFCQGLSLGGYSSGWRLPEKKELESLIDFGIGSPGPTIDPTAFPNTPSEWFWSATPYAGASGRAWGVHFSDGVSNFDGLTNYDGVTDPYRVRCVR